MAGGRAPGERAINKPADLYTNYDDFGQVATNTDANGFLTTYVYDLAGHDQPRRQRRS